MMTARVRPLLSGASISHLRSATPGTLGCFVLANGYPALLSCNHILALVAVEGKQPLVTVFDPVVQPASYETGQRQENMVAFLYGWTVIKPENQGINHIDAAWAVLRRDLWPIADGWSIQHPDGGRIGPVGAAKAGDRVVFAGRTSGVVRTTIKAISASVPVTYGDQWGTIARFEDVLLLNAPGAAPGDSGALVLKEETREAVGMIFAGASGYAAWAWKLQYLPPQVRILGVS